MPKKAFIAAHTWTHMSLMLLQVKSGARYAKGPSSAEFRDIMDAFVLEAEHVMARACEFNQHKVDKMRPVYSLDNWTGHFQALNDLGFVEGDAQRAPVPARSHDIQKPVEHIFNTTAYQFGHKLWMCNKDDDVDYYMEVLEDILFEIPVGDIQRDILSLNATYHNILERGGDWADKKNR